jgi:multiple sugar transport system permease protein
MKNRPIVQIPKYLVAAVVLVFFATPIVWVVLTSIKPNLLITNKPPVWIFRPTLDHFINIFANGRVQASLANSLIIAFGATALSLLVGVPAAYALARFRIRGRKHLAFYFLSARMIPPVVTIIPLFATFRFLGLLDTHLGLMLAYLTFNFPFAVWMMRGFFRELPVEIEEAAIIDGCRPFQAFLRVAVPLSAPGLAATAILCFVFAWNEFLLAVILTSYRAKTLPVAALSFMTDRLVLWGELSASSILIFTPVVIFAFLVRRYLLKGLTMGAIR